MRVLILTPGQLRAAQEGQQRTQEVQGPGGEGKEEGQGRQGEGEGEQGDIVPLDCR